MDDQIIVELLKTIRTLANSKSQHICELIGFNRLIINNVLGVKTDACMTSYNERKIQVIKVVRKWTGLGLKEAKDFVESVPVKLHLPENPERMQDYISDLRKAGATIEIIN